LEWRGVRFLGYGRGVEVAGGLGIAELKRERGLVIEPGLVGSEDVVLAGGCIRGWFWCGGGRSSRFGDWSKIGDMGGNVVEVKNEVVEWLRDGNWGEE